MYWKYKNCINIYVGISFHEFLWKFQFQRRSNFVASDPINSICYKILYFNEQLISWSTQQKNPLKLVFNEYWYNYSGHSLQQKSMTFEN